MISIACDYQLINLLASFCYVFTWCNDVAGLVREWDQNIYGYPSLSCQTPDRWHLPSNSSLLHLCLDCMWITNRTSIPCWNDSSSSVLWIWRGNVAPNSKGVTLALTRSSIWLKHFWLLTTQTASVWIKVYWAAAVCGQFKVANCFTAIVFTDAFTPMVDGFWWKFHDSFRTCSMVLSQKSSQWEKFVSVLFFTGFYTINSINYFTITIIMNL